LKDWSITHHAFDEKAYPVLFRNNRKKLANLPKFRVLEYEFLYPVRLVSSGVFSGKFS
jgi:hypothetical protein